MSAAPATPCPWCGSLRGVVHVHGHGQCANCGTNVQPCCGADAPSDASLSASAGEVDAGAAPQLFPSLFDALGGRDVTVTADSLRFALTGRLGCDLAEADLLLEAAVHVGILRLAGERLYRLTRT